MVERKLKEFTEKAVNLAVPPVLAAMFWAIIVLLVVFATAEGKDSPFTAFFTAFGAAGQVFFAWMVWRIARQQLRFVEVVEERQHRVETFQIKKDIIADFKKETALITLVHHIGSSFGEISAIVRQMDHVFSDHVVELAYAFLDELEMMISLANKERGARGADKQAHQTIEDELNNKLNDVIDVYTDLENALEDDLTLKVSFSTGR